MATPRRSDAGRRALLLAGFAAAFTASPAASQVAAISSVERGIRSGSPTLIKAW
jgi:hypothetical protein